MFFIALDDEESQLKTERLYYRYRRVMYAAAYEILHDHALAEDAISEAFVRVIRNLHKIDEAEKNKTKNFLVIICRNVAKDMLKSKLYLNNDAEFAAHLCDEINPEKIVLSKEAISKIAEIIYGLEEIYRDVLILRYENNLSRTEIAEMLNVKEETVKKRLQRAKAKVMEQLEKEGIIDG